PGLVDVELGDGRRESIAARHVVLASGSVAARPPIEGLDLPGVVFSTGALQIDSVPERFVVIGGGVIGMEFACIHEALGSRVTVLEAARTILPAGVDAAIAQRLQLLLRRRGIDIRVGIDVKAIEASSDGLRVVTQSPDSTLAVEADRVLIATGRWPNTDHLGLEECGVNRNGRFIAVDDRLATSLPGVWAIGDAVGGWMLAHKAMVEGRVVAENLVGGLRRVDHRAVPNVIFTRPEVAGVGLTESDARAAGAEVKVAQFAFSANPKARILGERDGVVRLVCEAGSGRVLGVHMLGPHVTDLIAEGALAVQAGVTADELAWTTHAHPTLPEAMLEAALGFRGASIHMSSR
ncbi:MAG: dihydrolipoyl dehydrogenase family protein, partial [Isosphaeraceae bacterium]